MSIPAHGAVDLGALAAARAAQAQSEQRAAARAADPSAVRVVIDVTDASFEAEVIAASSSVPVVIDLWATWCGPCKTLSPVLERLAEEYAGRWVLAKVDVDANPAIAQAFAVQSIPSVFAVIGGRPMPLFQGALPEAQVRAYLEKLLEVAAANGVTGTIGDPAGPAAEPAADLEPAADPRMEAAYDAIEAGDWAAARAAYQSMLDSAPADPLARAGIALVGVFERVDGAEHADVLAAADKAPDDLAAQERAADVLVLDGRPVEAFARLVGAIRFTSGADRERLRAHLLDLFEVVGADDPSVSRARIDLANALF
ncbi:MAG: tetratricopeptide repeat protein [Candidatus Nanopelagicales bacterium]